MKRYIIHITYKAEEDINSIYHYIAEELMAPTTAINYYRGIFYTIRDLSTTAGIYAFSQNEFIQSRYGRESRTIRYKKMTIIYNMIGNRVIIRRVIAGSLIK